MHVCTFQGVFVYKCVCVFLNRREAGKAIEASSDE